MNALLRPLLAVLASTSAIVFAQDVAPNDYQQAGFNPNRDFVNESFSEHIDPFTGNLEFHYVDISIPGNGGFDLKVQRSYNLATATNGMFNSTISPFGIGWDIHFGRVHHASNQPTCVYSTSSPNSLFLELPDGSTQAFYKVNGSMAGTSTSTDYVTQSLWKGQCLSAGGMRVWSPDGTFYDMTLDDTNRHAWVVTTKTDARGNVMNYSYTIMNGFQVPTSVTRASDGASATFAYNANMLTSITAQGRIWQYHVASIGGINELQSMQPPVGASWLYTYYPLQGTTPGSYAIQQATYPTGGSIAYNYGTVNFLNVVGYPANTVVTSKQTSDGSWTYAYAPSTGQGVFDVTTETMTQSGQPTISTIYKHYGYNTVAAGNVWQIGLLNQKSIGSVQTETNTWTSSTISAQSITRPGYAKFDTTVQLPMLASHVVTRDSATYTSNYSNFDSYGHPGAVSETGNASRSRTITYTNLSSLWILGLPTTETLTGMAAGVNNVITRVWNTATGTMTSETRFGVLTSFIYMTDGSLNTRTDARNNITTYGNYVRGVPQTETRPVTGTITRVVDNFGNVTSLNNGEATWAYGFDNLNRLTSIIYPVGTTAIVSWVDSPPSRTLTRGAFIDAIDFDGYGRVVSRERGDILVQYRYDALGRKVFQSLPDSAQGTTFTFDAIGRVTGTSSPDGTTSTQYTPGNATAVTNERNFTRTYAYQRYGDPDKGFVTGITMPAGNSVTMTRDTQGALLTAVQGGFTRTYGYNTNYFLGTIAEPETGTTTFGRDAVGNMTSKRVGTSATLTYTYDNLNRLATAAYGGTAGTTSFTYWKRGMVHTVSNSGPASVRTYTYDGNGNLTDDTLVVDGRTFDTQYAYNAIDGLDSITYPTQMGTSNNVVSMSADPLGRPTQLAPIAPSITYHNSGNLASVTYGNGFVTTFSEEPNRLIPNGVSALNAGVSLSYTYDGVGNVTSISGSEASSFTYDGSDRLSGANGPWGAGTMTYDNADNLTSYILTGQGLTLHMNATTNRVSSVSFTGDPTNYSYTYDAFGNVTSNASSTFAFDNASNLVCTNCTSGTTPIFAYDGRGWRIWQNKNGQKTYFVHAPNGDLLFEYTPGTPQWKQHVYLAGKRIATRASDLIPTTTSLSINNDASGTPIQLVATVSPSAATGTVTFLAEGFRIDAPVSFGSAVWNIAGILGGAVDTFHAAYSGDMTYAPSSSGTVNVTMPVSIVVVTANLNPSAPVPNQSFSVNVSVAGAQQTPTGTVQLVIDGGAPVSAAAPNPVFQKPSGLSQGGHTVTVNYLGNSMYKPSTTSFFIDVEPGDAPPSVSFVTPNAGSTVLVRQPTNVDVLATDSDGSVASVVVTDGTENVGLVQTGSDYRGQWTPARTGPATLTAQVYDDMGGLSTATVHVTVVCSPTDQPPNVPVITSPANGTTVSGPTTLALAATATDPDGLIDHVEYYSGTTLIGSSAIAPYSLSWQVANGNFTITAIAYDDCGNTTSSTPVNITVNGQVGFANGGFEAPVVSGAPQTAPTGWTVTGASYSLATKAYVDSISIPQADPPEGTQMVVLRGTATLSQQIYLTAGTWQLSFRAQLYPGSVQYTVKVLQDNSPVYEAPVAIGSWSYHTTQPITIAQDGLYTFTFGAGQTSSGIQLFVDNVSIHAPASPPSVSLTTDSSTYLTGGTATLTAIATDNAGVAKVEFFNGSAKLGEDTSSPYSLAWTAAGMGVYSLTAVATNIYGLQTTSAPVSVTVNYPPVAFANGGFEQPVVSTVTTLPAGYSWAPQNGGVSLEPASYFTIHGLPVPPEGSQAAEFLLSTSEPLVEQTVFLPPGGYAVTYRAMADGAGAQTLVLNNGISLWSFSGVPSTSWGTFTSASFAVAAGGANVPLSIFGAHSTTAQHLWIDDVRIIPAIVNPSFETPSVGSSEQALSASSSWNSIGPGATLASATYLSSMYGLAPQQGSQAVALEQVGGGISQTGWLPQGTYALSVYVAGVAGGGANLSIQVNGTQQMLIVNPPAGVWGAYVTNPFVVAAGGAMTTFSIINQGSKTIIDTVQLLPLDTPPNVSLTTPTGGQSFGSGIPVSLTATASDPDGAVAYVKFYDGSTEIATANSSPYTAAWSSTTLGAHTITAKAFDNVGGATTSMPARISIVCPASDTPPTASLTAPTSGQVLVSPSAITLTASASDSDGTISKVEFYQGTIKIGEKTAAPYTLSWTGVAPGPYTLTAFAIDNCGVSTQSAPVTITVSEGFVNAGFESPVVTVDTTLPASSSWTSSTGGVTLAPSSDLTSAGLPPPPEGSQFVIMNSATATSLSQSVSLPPGNYYVQLQAAGKLSPGGLVFNVNGAVLSAVTGIPVNTWTTAKSLVFTVPTGAGSTQLQIQTQAQGGINSIRVDNMQIIPSP